MQGCVWGIQYVAGTTSKLEYAQETVTAGTCCSGMFPWVVILQSKCKTDFEECLFHKFNST